MPNGRTDAHVQAGIAVAGDHYDVIGKSLYTASDMADGATGGAICGSFVIFGGLSVLLYKPWRRRIDRKRERDLQPQHSQHDEEFGTLPELIGTHADIDLSQKDRETPSTANDVKGTTSLLEPEAPPSFGSCQGTSSRSVVEL